MQTIAATAEALAMGTTSSVQLAEACLARAADANGEGKRVFISLVPDKVRAQAAASDALRKHGIVPSPLAGVTVSVKDLWDVQGEVTAAGSKALADSPPASRDAPTIARLRAAGAVFMGRTNMTEFAYSGVGLNPHYGTPSSPWDRKTGRVPGGSSSGAAVSVADGMAVVGLGTDTGGSCRIPAALCGTVGWKPTARRIPLDGVAPLGVLARQPGLDGRVRRLRGVDRPDHGRRGRPPADAAAVARASASACSRRSCSTGSTRTSRRPTSAASRLCRRPAPCSSTSTSPPSQRMPSAFAKGGLTAAEASAWHKTIARQPWQSLRSPRAHPHRAGLHANGRRLSRHPRDAPRAGGRFRCIDARPRRAAHADLPDHRACRSQPSRRTRISPASTCSCCAIR